MYAIIETGGRQFRAEPGATLKLPALKADVGEEVTFERVLLARTEDDEVKVGSPTVDGAEVVGSIVGHGKGEKIIVFKWKRRKNYRRKQGHRQKFTEVRIDEIRFG